MVVVVLALVGACTSGGAVKPRPTAPAPAVAGGTLRVGVLTNGQCEFTFCGGQHDDPQWAGEDPMMYEVLRCCLTRTLLSYNGRPTNRGGTLPRPDLAAGLPTISDDGLTWTFHLKRGLHYAPPLQRVEISASDFVRSIERLLGPPPPDGPDYYDGVLDPYIGRFLALGDLVSGGGEYVNGRATHIAGLETPDRYTVRIHLTRPDGALASLLTEPDTAPIPPNPFHPDARFGVLDGHSRLAFPFVVASGPYMTEGGEEVDFSMPPDQQLPASGDAASSLTLVRNPSWGRRTDGLRAAESDRIVLTPVANEGDALRLVQTAALDFVDNWQPPPDLLVPGAAGGGTSVYLSTRDSIYFIDLNTAMPPLDDLHVRRAINLAVDRSEIVDAFVRSGLPASAQTHIGLDTEEDDLLLNFDPYKSATGDLQAAREEMAQSAYDRDRDGRCDDPVCDGIRLFVPNDQPARVKASRIVARAAKAIGIGVVVVTQDPQTFGESYARPELHTAMLSDGWAKDLTSGSTYFAQLFGSPATGVTSAYGNSSLGATQAKLRKWGYSVTSVPSVDAQIERCLPLTFGAQVRCWAELDQYLMTQVVPWIPLVNLTSGRVTASTVSTMTFDQSDSTPMPTLDRVVLRAGGTPVASPTPSFPVPPIPEGVYRVTVSKADLFRFDPHSDPEGVDENTGTFTVYVNGGLMKLVATADHPIYNPLATGVYRGSGNEVTFEIQQPTFNALTLPTERWTFDGHTLHFSLVSCGKLNLLDPEAPHLCEDARTVFEAHPWEKVG